MDKNMNAGDHNAGGRNAGHYNAGDHNAGDFNAGDHNAGYLNTEDGPCRIFDVDHDTWDVEFPAFFGRVCPARWVVSGAMDADEKLAHPEHETTGSFLRVRTMHEAWREAWDSADEDDRRKVLEIPNWDNSKFEIISGIDAEAELAAKRASPPTMEVAGGRYLVADVESAVEVARVLARITPVEEG